MSHDLHSRTASRTRQDVKAHDHIGKWWRFDRYEISEGYIRPTADARLESYDPWSLYRTSFGQRGGRAPYESLARLSRQLGDARQTPTRAMHNDAQGRTYFVRVAEDHDQHIADWCSQYGLLGLLPARARIVALAPRWYLDETLPPVDPHIVRRPDMTEEELATSVSFTRQDRLVPRQLIYRRSATGWLTYSIKSYQERDEAVIEGGLVKKAYLPDNWPAPYAILEAPFGVVGNVHKELRPWPLSEEWAGYFPSVQWGETETYPYPAPLSDAFWRLYGETVTDFYHAARLFRQVLENLAGTDVASEVPRETRVARCRRYLAEMVAGAQPTLAQTESGRLQQVFSEPSLLSTLGMMLLLDLDRYDRVRTCDLCTWPFVAHTSRDRFCEEKCRRTWQQGDRRARQVTTLAEALMRESPTTLADRAGAAARSLLRHSGSLERLRRDAANADVAELLPLAQRHVPGLTVEQLRRAAEPPP